MNPSPVLQGKGGEVGAENITCYTPNMGLHVTCSEDEFQQLQVHPIAVLPRQGGTCVPDHVYLCYPAPPGRMSAAGALLPL